MTDAYLHLSDGSVLRGNAIGYLDADIHGEVVFSTGMTGYCQSLTDPSFAGQILTFTYPLIGNYGVPSYQEQDSHVSSNFESEKIWVSGVILSSYTSFPSHYQSVRSFSDWLAEEKIPGIANIDTRFLTLKLREHGVLQGSISLRAEPPSSFAPFPSNIVSQVSIKQSITYTPVSPNGKHIALIDCGVKHGIIRRFLEAGYKITRLPYDASPLDIPNIDGVVVSNGPGDPKDCGKTIEIIKKVLANDIPYLGICLGNQLLALSIGADTYKLPYGHRGLNQPCKDIQSNKVYITSQNHGYAVDNKTLPSGYTPWFMNLNDGTNEGIMHTSKPIRSVQFHPEGCPGPFDTDWIFSSI